MGVCPKIGAQKQKFKNIALEFFYTLKYNMRPKDASSKNLGLVREKSSGLKCIFIS